MLNEEAENRYYNRIRRRITDIRRRHIYYSFRKPIYMTSFFVNRQRLVI